MIGYETQYGVMQRRARESARAVRQAGHNKASPAPQALRHAELREKTLAQLPELQGDEAQHNEPLRAACDNVMTLLRQELDEGEPSCVAMLAAILQSLVDFANVEAMEYGPDDDGAGYGGGAVGDDDDNTSWARMADYARVPDWRSTKAGGEALVWKSMAAQVTDLDEADGTADVIANSSLLDAQDDVLTYGCWGDVIAEMKRPNGDAPALCWAHQNGMDAPLILLGGVVDAKELAPGDPRIPDDLREAGASALWARVQFDMDDPAARSAFSKVKKGFIRRWSVGIQPDPVHTRLKDGVRIVDKIKRWLELSPVLIGASIGTRTLDTKGGAFLMPMEDPVRLDAEGEAMVEAFMAKHFGSATEELVPSFIARHSMDPAIAGPAHAQRAAMEEAVNRRYVDGPGPNYSDAEWDTKIERFGGYPNSLGAGPARRWTDQDSSETTPRVPEQWQLGRVERMVGVR